MQLNDAETKIVNEVVNGFIYKNEPTKRRNLIVKFRSPETVDRLINLNILKALDNDDNIAPWACGVEFAADKEAVTRAKASLEVVLQALQELFDVTPTGKQITRNEVQIKVNETRGETVGRVIDRGLYFITEFLVLKSYGPAPGPVRRPLFNIEWMVLSDRVVTLDVKTAWDNHIEICVSRLKAAEGSNTSPPMASPSSSDSDDRRFARMAVDVARKSESENDGRPHPKVGAVVVKNGNLLCTAHRGEVLGNHAEFVALEKKLGDVALAGATVYTTLEPCTTRNHPKVPCAKRLAQRKIARVVIGMLDPDTRITGKGQRSLRQANIITDLFPHDLMAEVEEMNREFTEFCEQQQIPGVQKSSPTDVSTNMPEELNFSTRSDLRKHGRHWVENTLKEIIENRGLTLDSPFRWTPDSDREIYTLEVSIEGVTKCWRLSFEALEDCIEDKNIRRTIERSLVLYFVPDRNESVKDKTYDTLSEEEVAAALKRHQNGERLDQLTIDILDREGFVLTTDVTHMQSKSRELLLVSITPKGLRLLKRFQP
jgi:pyrimidine deaminase RibD-like protein